jgi:hypothetical protein
MLSIRRQCEPLICGGDITFFWIAMTREWLPQLGSWQVLYKIRLQKPLKDHILSLRVVHPLIRFDTQNAS